MTKRQKAILTGILEGITMFLALGAIFFGISVLAAIIGG